MSGTNELLTERGRTHGDFHGVSHVYIGLGGLISKHGSDEFMDNADIQYAFDMILVKLARIACGDCTFKDHWDDIAGYAALVARQLP